MKNNLDRLKENCKKTKSKLMKINFQYMENYNCDSSCISESYFKFKGGVSMLIQVSVFKHIFEKNAYGEGLHSFYELPEHSDATLVAMATNYFNNGELGDFMYLPTDWNFINIEEFEESVGTEDSPTEIFTAEELKIIKYSMYKFSPETQELLKQKSRYPL